LTDLTKIETKILVSKQKSKTKEAKVRVKQKKLETLTKTKILFKTKKALHFLSGFCFKCLRPDKKSLKH